MKGVLPISLDPDTLENMTEEEKLELIHAKQSMESCVHKFLGLDESRPSPFPKQYRVGTQRWLQALDHALWALTGMGLEQFATADTKIVGLSEEDQAVIQACLAGPRRTLSVGADQMSTGPSGTSFLQSTDYRLAMDLLMDPPHRLSINSFSSR